MTQRSRPASDAPPRPEPARYREVLARMDRLADLTDSRFRIPGTPIRFGIDGILGLVPGIGDLVGLGISLYLYSEAWRIGAPGPVRRRMLGNMLIDFLVGLVPLFGDVLDVAFKANVRNQALLRNWLERELVPIDADESPRSMVFGTLGLLVMTATAVALLRVLQAA